MALAVVAFDRKKNYSKEKRAGIAIFDIFVLLPLFMDARTVSCYFYLFAVTSLTFAETVLNEQLFEVIFVIMRSRKLGNLI